MKKIEQSLENDLFKVVVMVERKDDVEIPYGGDINLVRIILDKMEELSVNEGKGCVVKDRSEKVSCRDDDGKPICEGEDSDIDRLSLMDIGDDRVDRNKLREWILREVRNGNIDALEWFISRYWRGL